MLLNLVRDQKPKGVVVAFDRPEPTFRHEMLPEYKAQREPTPDLLIQQFGLVREVLEALNVPAVDAVGFEADDVLATIATQVADSGDEAIIVTGDRDIYQMVRDPFIKVLYNRRGVSDYALYDEAGIIDRTGVSSDLYPQYAALRGDPSDNLPGIPGVGEKTAAKLINAYGGLDGIFEHAEDQTPKLQQNLVEFEERARQNFDAMVLRTDVPIDLDSRTFNWGEVDVAKVQRLFDLLEFNSLYERLSELLGGLLPTLESEGGVLEAELVQIASASEFASHLDSLLTTKEPLSLGWSTDNDGSLSALAVVLNAETAEVMAIEGAVLEEPAALAALQRVLAEGGGFDTHHAKEFGRGLRRLGLHAEGLRTDTAIAAYLIDPTGGRYVLDDLLRKYCRSELTRNESAEAGQLELGVGSEDLLIDAARDALAVNRLVPVLLTILQDLSLIHI